jgi:hypothetical protein
MYKCSATSFSESNVPGNTSAVTRARRLVGDLIRTQLGYALLDSAKSRRVILRCRSFDTNIKARNVIRAAVPDKSDPGEFRLPRRGKAMAATTDLRVSPRASGSAFPRLTEFYGKAIAPARGRTRFARFRSSRCSGGTIVVVVVVVVVSLRRQARKLALPIFDLRSRRSAGLPYRGAF